MIPVRKNWSDTYINMVERALFGLAIAAMALMLICAATSEAAAQAGGGSWSGSPGTFPGVNPPPVGGPGGGIGTVFARPGVTPPTVTVTEAQQLIAVQRGPYSFMPPTEWRR